MISAYETLQSMTDEDFNYLMEVDFNIIEALCLSLTLELNSNPKSTLS